MKILLLLGALFVIQLTFLNKANAQDFQAFVPDNYSGASGMFYNPANIADSRYKFDIEMLGAAVRLENNWYQLDPSVIFNIKSFSDSNFTKKYLTLIENNDPKYAFQSAEVRLLSFMLNITDKSAIGFSIRAREMINMDNIDPDAAELITNANKVDHLLNTPLHFQNMSQTFVGWADYGLTYSQVIIDQRKHFLKAGITGRLLQGMGSVYLVEKDMKYSIDSANIALGVHADVKFGASSNIEDIMQYKFAAKPGLGIDFGFVYEFRPNYKDHKYNMDGKKNLWRKDQNKYLFKVSFSMLDYGSMKFKKEFNSNDFIINEDSLVLDDIDISSIKSLADSLYKQGLINGTDPYYNFRLPTTFNIDIDYHITGGFYVNMAGRLALNQGFNYFSKAHYLNNLSLGLRYESKYFGVSLPFHYNQYSNFDLGLGIRLGPLWIGSSNLLALTGIKKSITSEDFYFALKLPILYKAPKDADGDLVSDKYDKCKFDKGTWELNGCPDSDGDGIINIEDDCAYTAGLAKFNGCPDTDGDGIEDKLDECPDIAGSKLFAGCPDSDEDGIVDKNDSCPNISGPKIYFGCPDTDGDSIADNLDDCPELKGSPEFHGCPDTDGDGLIDAIDLCPNVAGLDSLQGCPYTDTDNDGIQDKYDKCPKMAGPIENGGCPYADSDNDSVVDKDDLCPMTPGLVSNNGCPVIAKKEQEILNTAFNNLEFENGKSTIVASSFDALDELAELMKKRDDFNLLVEGHTDNVGRENANMSLSKNRANAIKNYLISKGIDKSRIETKWYGDTKPIADNSTEEGRHKNRRVELTVVFN